MSTEVGSLQASLTLDLTDFRTGMAQAVSLANQLGAQLKAAFSGDIGIKQALAQVAAFMEQIDLLRGRLSELQASLNTNTGANLFAQMRTHTASLSQDLDKVQSVLTGAMSSAQGLNSSLQGVVASSGTVVKRLTTIQQGLFTMPTMDFSSSLTQLQQMQAAVTQITTMLQAVGNVDMNSGEMLSGDSPSSLYNIIGIIGEINSSLERAAQLTSAVNAETISWLQNVRQVAGQFNAITESILQTTAAAKGSKNAIRDAANAGGSLDKQTRQVNKNLQSTKGYAISIKGILGGIVISQAFYQMLGVVEELVQGAISFTQNMQDAAVAFEYLMQGANVSSGAFLNALREIALYSSLDTTDLTSASRKLMAMGFSAKATVPALQILTDTAAVFSNNAGEMTDMIDHIALAFGQMIAAGKVSAQELRQLYNAGLPIYELLADGLGITTEMAKNIGHYNIDSATAVYAVLLQLQKRYGGAAQELSKTISGSISVIREAFQQLLSFSWQEQVQQITDGLNVIARRLQALVQITQVYGLGGLFQAIFPPSMWQDLRMVIGGLGQIITAFKIFGSILLDVAKTAAQMAATIGSYVVPVVGTLAVTIMGIARAAITTFPFLKQLLGAIMLLVVANAVTKGIILLAKAIYLLTGAKAAVAAIKGLIGSFLAFATVHPVVAIALMAIAAAFLAIVASSEKAKAAIASFFGGIRDSFRSFGEKLQLGFDPGEIAMPEFTPPDLGDFTAGLEDMTNGMENLGDETEEAGKKAKKANKNLQSFDEVYSIDDEKDSGLGGIGDSLGSIYDALEAIGNLDYSNLFDWTGDWATDWGNISAGIGDLSDALGEIEFDAKAWAQNFWKSLAAAIEETPNIATSLMGAAIGAVIGGLLGHPLIGAAIGALAGWFWADLAEKLNLSNVGTFGLPIATALGGVIGNLLGHPIIGAGIGALVGWLIDAIGQGIEGGDWSQIGYPIGIGLGTAIGFIAGGPVGAIIGGAIGALVGWIADLLITGFTTGEWNFAAIGTAIGTGLGAAIGLIVGGPVGAAIGAAIGTVVGWIVGKFIEADWSAVGDAFLEPLRDLWNSLGEFFDELWEPIKAAWEEKDWLALGVAVVEGIIYGIIGAIGGVVQAVVAFFEGLWNAFCEIFGIHSPAKEMEPIGENILNGVLEGILHPIATLNEWLDEHVFTPFREWFVDTFNLETFYEDGELSLEGLLKGILKKSTEAVSSWFNTNVKNPILGWFDDVFNLDTLWDAGSNLLSGLLRGIKSGVGAIWDWIKGFGSSFKEKFNSVFKIHSPSRMTEWSGQMLDAGLIEGMRGGAQKVFSKAAEIAKKVTSAMTPESAKTDFLNFTGNSMNQVTSWAQTFKDTIHSTLEEVSTYFATFGQQMAEMDAKMQSIPQRLNSRVPSLAAADQLGSASTTTGTLTASQIIVTISEMSITRLAETTAARIYEFLAPLFAQLSPGDQQRVMAYIGTLIADDRSLRKLKQQLDLVDPNGRRGS